MGVILIFVSDNKHVVLIHGAWGRGDTWGPAQMTFEERGFTVHTPTLRHHELPVQEGATKISGLSIRDYTNDLVALVESLDSPPLIVGLSIGGLLAQLVAARTRHAGVVVACPARAAGIFAASPTSLRSNGSVLGRHFWQLRPWAKPLYPPTWDQWRRCFANAQTEEDAREGLAGLVCESGRAISEILCPSLDRGKATTVNFAAVTTPVLVIRGEFDRFVPPQLPLKTASRYQNSTLVEIPCADHLVFFGEALPVTMGHIDDWIAKNHVLTS